MFKKALILAAVALLFVGAGCAGGSTPTTPDKGMSMADYFGSLPTPSPACAKFTYTANNGKVLLSGTLGKHPDGSLYVMESRGAQEDIPFMPLGAILCIVTYNNPAGTIPSGPFSGYPFYYIGQTVDYDINILSLLDLTGTGIGPYQFTGPPHIHAEQHYAHIDPLTTEIIADGPLPGAYAFDIDQAIGYGYQVINDTYFIPAGTNPGLDVTTVRVTCPLGFGLFDLVFFDDIAGIWDPQ